VKIPHLTRQYRRGFFLFRFFNLFKKELQKKIRGRKIKKQDKCWEV